MTEQNEKPWTHYLRPIWIGTGIGIALGVIVYIIGVVFNVEHVELFTWGEGPTGSGGGYSSTSAVPAVLAAWGFGIGLLIAIRQRVLRHK